MTAAASIILKYLTLLITIILRCSSFIDIRHRFELREIPIGLKQQILAECNSTLIKFFKKYEQGLHFLTKKAQLQTESSRTTKENMKLENETEMRNTGEIIWHPLHVKEISLSTIQQCPMAVNNCIFAKTTPFMEHCDVKCLTIDGRPTNDLNCWNDNCFIRATRICEEKFWRTVKVKYRKKKKKRMRCIPEIKHCYKLACLKCLGRECNMNCYGGGIQYTHLTKQRWKGYDEYKNTSRSR
ncbi:hypothetical protein DINM_001983 [Dirofilaria immitis]|nr:hypothetical protein [Dirofilaria immitis]